MAGSFIRMWTRGDMRGGILGTIERNDKKQVSGWWWPREAYMGGAFVMVAWGGGDGFLSRDWGWGGREGQ